MCKWCYSKNTFIRLRSNSFLLCNKYFVEDKSTSDLDMIPLHNSCANLKGTLDFTALMKAFLPMNKYFKVFGNHYGLKNSGESLKKLFTKSKWLRKNECKQSVMDDSLFSMPFLIYMNFLLTTCVINRKKSGVDSFFRRLM